MTGSLPQYRLYTLLLLVAAHIIFQPKELLPRPAHDSPQSAKVAVENIFEGRDLACYGSQGPASNYQTLKETLEKASKSTSNNNSNTTFAFFYHSYDEPCEGCIFQTNTSFAEGKNLVTHTAMNSPLWKRCKYWTFYDDDVVVKMNGKATSDEAWAEYHKLLLAEDTKDALIKPRDSGRDKETYDTYQSCVDEHFVTFRYDHVGIFWPLTTQYRENYFVNSEFFFLRVAKCFPNGIRVVHNFETVNEQHRHDTSRYTTTEIFQRIFDEELPELSPWTYIESLKSHQFHRCSVAVVPSFGWHPTCASVMNRYLYEWLEKPIQAER